MAACVPQERLRDVVGDEESCGLTLSPQDSRWDGRSGEHQVDEDSCGLTWAAAPHRLQERRRDSSRAREWLKFLRARVGGRREHLGKQGFGPEHRVVCLDWLMEVRNAFGLRHTTMSRCAALFDEVLMRMQLTPPQMQLYAVTCLVISAKMEEPYHVSIDQYADMTAGTVTRKDVLQAEACIMRQLAFRVIRPSLVDVLQPLIAYLGAPFTSSENIIYYAAEASYYSTVCCCLPLSHVAAAVLSAATGGRYDADISAAVSQLLGVSCWEAARAAVTAALEECHVHELKNTCGRFGAEISLGSKSYYELIMRRSRGHPEEDEDVDDDASCGRTSAATDSDSEGSDTPSSAAHCPQKKRRLA